MTYQINDTTILALVDTGGMLTFDYLCIFVKGEKVVSVSSIVPAIRFICILKDYACNCYDAVVIYTDDHLSRFHSTSLEVIASYITSLILANAL